MVVGCQQLSLGKILELVEVLQNYFERESIDARVFFWPLSSSSMFETVPEITTLMIFQKEL